MSKSDPIEQALDRISDLCHATETDSVIDELRQFLHNRSNLVVAKAAKLTGELDLKALVPDLLIVFDKLMAGAPRLDKNCIATTEINTALYQLDFDDPAPFLRGIRHFQLEGSFGPPVDAAAKLRGISAQALLRTRYPDALHEVLPLLLDPEPSARIGAVRALATNGGEAGVLLLKLKVLSGDPEPEVTSECFVGLLAAAPEKSVMFVGQYIDSKDSAIAETAVLALGESRQPSAFQLLKEKWTRTVEDTARKVLLIAMASSRLEEAIAFLISIVSKSATRTAVDAIEALSPYRTSERVREAVADAVSRRNESVLRKAFAQHLPAQ